ncbi:MAG: RNA polymerase sigma factor [Acidimicrobiales bacterium]
MDEEVSGWSEAGDPAAFVELFWRHGPAVHAYLARRSGRQDADDLLSEVWLRAFKGRLSYDRRCPDARPWLYGIARNVLRAHWHEAARPVAPATETVAWDPWPDVDTHLDAAARSETLRHVLGVLSEDEREVLLLVVWEQLTPAEVAVALRIPQGTARSRLHRGLSALRREAVQLVGSYPKEAR